MDKKSLFRFQLREIKAFNQQLYTFFPPSCQTIPFGGSNSTKDKRLFREFTQFCANNISQKHCTVKLTRIT